MGEREEGGVYMRGGVNDFLERDTYVFFSFFFWVEFGSNWYIRGSYCMDFVFVRVGYDFIVVLGVGVSFCLQREEVGDV